MNLLPSFNNVVIVELVIRESLERHLVIDYRGGDAVRHAELRLIRRRRLGEGEHAQGPF